MISTWWGRELGTKCLQDVSLNVALLTSDQALSLIDGLFFEPLQLSK